MFSIANVEGIVTKISQSKELADGHKIRNLVIATELHNKQIIFHDIVLWNELNEIFIKKNSKVKIVGELKYKQKNGNKYSEIIAKNIEVLNV